MNQTKTRGFIKNNVFEQILSVLCNLKSQLTAILSKQDKISPNCHVKRKKKFVVCITLKN